MWFVVQVDSAVSVFLAQISISGGIPSEGKLSDHSIVPTFTSSTVTVSGVVSGMSEQLARSRLAVTMRVVILFIQREKELSA